MAKDVKLVANVTTHCIHCHYNTNGTTGTYTFESGLNKVKPKVLEAIMKQSGNKKLFDNGSLSVAGGDVSAAADVTDAAESGVESRAADAPAPVPTGNQKNQGPNLAKTDVEAIENAKDNDTAEANKNKSKGKKKGKSKK